MNSEIKKLRNYNDLNYLLSSIENEVVGKAFLTTFHKLYLGAYEKVLCSISGGSDSDILLDIIYRCDSKSIVDSTCILYLFT